jgi:predicted membrane channel-forming protein YqfA (hemolysin III family)
VARLRRAEEVRHMNIGVSIFLITLGAILTFAVDVSVSGLDLNAIGVILLVVGGLWLLLSLILYSTRRSRRVSGGLVEERRVYDEGPTRAYDDNPLP